MKIWFLKLFFFFARKVSQSPAWSRQLWLSGSRAGFSVQPCNLEEGTWKCQQLYLQSFIELSASSLTHLPCAFLVFALNAKHWTSPGLRVKGPTTRQNGIKITSKWKYLSFRDREQSFFFWTPPVWLKQRCKRVTCYHHSPPTPNNHHSGKVSS